MSDNQHFEELLESYLRDTASPEEWTLLLKMIQNGEYDDALREKMDAVLAQQDNSLDMSTDRAHDLLYKVLSAEKHTAKLLPLHQSVRKIGRVAAAVILVISLSIAGYFIFNNRTPKEIAQKETQQPPANDLIPGGNKAILTLGSGQKIILNNAPNGQLAHQGNTTIIKADSGKLAYKVSGQAPAEIAYNTLTTPRGGQYQLTLPDGSRAWLNAASSIRYPTAFAANSRRVEITGEVYFEVKHDAAQPFTVAVNGIEVHDLGTAFNIDAYNDESAIKTTLLQGSVRVSQGSVSKVIRPGEQVIVPDNGPLTIRTHVDVDGVIAWKNGLFSMDKTDIKTFMRMVSRWYDVDVEYEGALPGGTISGEAQRSLTFSQIKKVLQLTDIHFRIEGKKLIVSR